MGEYTLDLRRTESSAQEALQMLENKGVPVSC